MSQESCAIHWDSNKMFNRSSCHPIQNQLLLALIADVLVVQWVCLWPTKIRMVSTDWFRACCKFKLGFALIWSYVLRNIIS